MSIGKELLAAQRARFGAVDRLLPEPAPPAAGERLDAATAGGGQVSGILQRQVHGPGELPMLWSAAEVWQLFPYPGGSGVEGMDVLLRAWRARLDAENPGADSACVVNWPSQDTEAIRAFLDHGMVALSCLAVRTGLPPAGKPPGGVVIRRAGPRDFDAALALSGATFDYAGLVASAWRPNTAALLSPGLSEALGEENPAIWLAERAGTPVALAHYGWVDSTLGSPEGELLPPGLWGYVNNVVTAPEARGTGVGRALMSHVHAELRAEGAAGTYLYYNPPNPLSSVFWHRQGYRPLWTSWEARPAGRLR
ncbi:GNAT family N-acetyltransferase [Amycolatopsis sp. H20-H5]|uniref:GNAT family N-acetyltransferase n=1 Tax=Amycolatopsis sp. H20-H5 TaxID=3046309 RepID=UPI002DBB1B52|nr:GNAT family N-acetyltransferase [Amycolatopsis sp. H20-H5]MEC3974154.1 GNAT family N-acetyltransferase [Amycolatopsis sp. H20-H5]